MSLELFLTFGLGLVGIIDGDDVDLSNLHRQIIHVENTEGIKKVFSAKITLEE